MSATPRRAAALAVLLAGAALLVGRGLGDESLAFVGNDEVRYVMNGVFLRDMVADRPFSSVSSALNYARHYYAQYPALSLGFHPPLLPIVEVPFFMLFGVGFTAARVALALFFMSAVLMLYGLVARLYGQPAGWLAAALFASNPFLVRFGRHVLSEMPALALMIAAAFFLDRFCHQERRRDLAAFVAAAAASVYAKQLAVVLFPAYLAFALVRLGGRRLAGRDIVIAAAALGLLVAPAVPMTLALSAPNVQWVASSAAGAASFRAYVSPVAEALGVQFSAVVLGLAALGLAKVIVQRDRRALVLLLWLAAALASLVFVTRAVEPPRYGIYLMPPLIGLAGIACEGWRRRGVGLALAGLAVVAVGSQTLTAWRQPLQRAPGYEAAARFVQARPRGSTILYSGEVDSGLFVLATRRHDPDRRAIVLRADKLLATADLSRLVDDRIASREEIYDLLRRLGVGYVVLEDRLTSSRALNWLREETRSSRFQERFQAPAGSADPRLAGASISVYEFREAGRPDPAAVVGMRIPIARSEVAVRLSDLIDGAYRR
jgi:hypothetical protein